MLVFPMSLSCHCNHPQLKTSGWLLLEGKKQESVARRPKICDIEISLMTGRECNRRIATIDFRIARHPPFGACVEVASSFRYLRPRNPKPKSAAPAGIPSHSPAGRASREP